MGFVNDLKNKVKKEVSAIKYDRELMKDPAVVRSRIDSEREQIRIEKQDLLSRRELESEKRELQSLKNSTGLRGQIKSGFNGLRTHLDNVKKRNESSIKLTDPLKKNNDAGKFEIKGNSSARDGQIGMRDSGSSYRPFGSGVMGDSQLVKKKKKSKDQTIIIMRR